jgi:hypothetical protein
VSGRARDQRGAVLPSPVVMLSILAVALAAVAFFATRGEEPTEREITTAGQEQPATPSGSADAPEEEETSAPPEPEKTKEPVRREEVGVVVFNNTTIAGLAGTVHAQVAEMGWNALAADNWYGTIPATTVYFPEGLKDAARQLALDLGVQRVVPAVGGMSTTNLTVILTGALD